MSIQIIETQPENRCSKRPLCVTIRLRMHRSSRTRFGKRTCLQKCSKSFSKYVLSPRRHCLIRSCPKLNFNFSSCDVAFFNNSLRRRCGFQTVFGTVSVNYRGTPKPNGLINCLKTVCLQQKHGFKIFLFTHYWF